MDTPLIPPPPADLPPPPKPVPRKDEFPTRMQVWIFAVLAVALIVEAALGVWTPLDIFGDLFR